MIKRLFLAVTCIVLMASCSPLIYTARGGHKDYSREAPVVIAPYVDVTAIGEGELIRQLFANGYDVISAEYDRHHSHGRPGGRHDHSQGETSHAGYIVEISCTLQPGTTNTYATYHAKVSDRENGRLIFAADLRKPKGARATVRALVKKMNSYIK